MTMLERLKEMNANGELPKHFTDEELEQIVQAESMCGGGCACCPMAPYENRRTPQFDKTAMENNTFEIQSSEPVEETPDDKQNEKN